MRNDGAVYLLVVCCLWPIAVHLFIRYGIPRILAWTAQQLDALTRIDWRHVRWSEIWSKRNE